MASVKTVVYTDHRNLLFIFHPRALQPNVQSYVVAKAQRWALYLSQFEYDIEHIPGELNDLPDLLTRWAKGYRQTLKVCRISVGSYDLLPSASDPDSIWPTMADVRDVQRKNNEVAPKHATLKEGLLRIRDKIWIPSNAHALQLTLMVIAHTANAGHRGIESTVARLQERFHWNGMRKDAETFIQARIHCISSRAGYLVPRPLQQT